MSIPSFIFGGSAKAQTPEQLKKLRAVAEALNGSNRAPRNIGEGLNAIGDAIMYRSLVRQAEDGEAAMRASGNSVVLEALNAGVQPSLDPSPNKVKEALFGAPEVQNELAASDPTPTKFSGNQQEFVNAMLPAAIEEGNRTGIDPRIIVGQAALETGYGKSAPGNNYFGIKSHGQGGGNSMMTTEVVNGQPVRVRDSFRAYESPADSVRGYGDFITQNPRYGKFRSAQGMDAQLSELQASGYATDPRYGAKVGSIARGIQLPNEMASADPQAAIAAAAPASGYVDPQVSAPNAQPQLAPQQPVQMAQAGNFPPAPPPPGQPSPGDALSMQKLYQAMMHPHVSESQQKLILSEIQRRQQANDPDNILKRQYMQAQTDALKAKPQKQWQKLDDNTLFNPESGETKRVGGEEPGAFSFSGSSVEAQSLNGLIKSGKLTPEQAQQLGAGKTISGPNGEIIFLTPQGVFGQQAGQPPQPVGGNGQPWQGVDIFGDGGPRSAPPQAMAPAQGSGNGPSLGLQPNGTINLTAPKVTIDESKAGGFADRMAQSGALVDKYGDAGLSTFDQTVTNSPYVPGFIANNLVGEDFQKYDQARRDFINAQLRRESGAVISPEEFDNANKQYFPQPGDRPDVLEQKRKNRETVIGAMTRDAGPTYRKRGGPEIEAARKAIEQGAPREKVIERLKSAGIDASGL